MQSFTPYTQFIMSDELKFNKFLKNSLKYFIQCIWKQQLHYLVTGKEPCSRRGVRFHSLVPNSAYEFIFHLK